MLSKQIRYPLVILHSELEAIAHSQMIFPARNLHL